MKKSAPFHLAFPVIDIKETTDFYVNTLGCEIGRSALFWVDFNFYGHQLTAHENAQYVKSLESAWRKDSKYPLVHFGAILKWEEWHGMEQKLRDLDVPFVIEPHVAFLGEIGEQKSMFLEDPSGYAIEFKTFENPKKIFKSK
ncbi:MAG: VOC family protein [Salibacteraceae bacterium]